MPEHTQTGRRLQVLLVDDSPQDIRLIQEAFKENDIPAHLSVAGDGEQAMAFLRRQGEYAGSPRPNFILLDLNMPRKNGREVLAEIKGSKEFRQIPVMILSTSTHMDDVMQAYDLHANCYMSKPTDLDSLMRLGKRLKAFWVCSVLLPF